MKKKLVLVMPLHFKLYEGIVNELKDSEYDLSILFLTDQPYNYRNLAERIYAFFQKNIFNKKDIKYQLAKIKNSNEIEKVFEGRQEVFDYILIFRPDLFTKEAILKLKLKAKKMIAYQWDGLNRFPDVFDLIPIFDRFGVFDIDDFSNFSNIFRNITLETNFYLEETDSSPIQSEEKVFFIGSYLKERISDIVTIADYLKLLQIKTDIRIFCNSKSIEKKYGENLVFFSEKINYLDVIKLVKNSTVLLDFENQIHNGVSFRIFEGLYYKKKIITNNPLVKTYDFYHPNNIFVLENDNFAEIPRFLSLNFIEIEENIVKKYSFRNWLNNLLTDPSQKLFL